MKTTRLGALCILAGSAALCGTTARADEFNNDVRLGLYAVFYHTSADDISGPYVPPGVNLKVQDVQTLYFAYVRSLPHNFQVELTLGYPPLTKIEGVGPESVGSAPDGSLRPCCSNTSSSPRHRWCAPTSGWESTTPSSMIASRPRPATPQAAVRRSCP
jgi:hypothetical protein